MEIKIDAEAVQAVVQQAIFDQLGSEGRDRLVQASLEHLLKTEPDQYGRPRSVSPLQRAFNDAVGIAARDIVIEFVRNDEEFKQRIKVVIGEAMLKIDEDDYSENVGLALGAALRKDR